MKYYELFYKVENCYIFYLSLELGFKRFLERVSVEFQYEVYCRLMGDRDL